MLPITTRRRRPTRSRGGWRRAGTTAVVSAAAVLTAGAAAGVSGASSSVLGPPAGGPDLAQIAFAVEDFPGAQVRREGYVQPDASFGFVAEYDRELRDVSATIGGKRLLGLEDDVSVARNPGDAHAAMEELTFGLGIGSAALKREFAKEFGVKPRAVTVGALRGAGSGEDSFSLRVAVHTKRGELDLVIAGVRVGPVVSLFYVEGAPKVVLGIAETKRLARLADRHSRSGLAPSAVVEPALAGTPQVGQTLTVAPATWTNAPTTIAYRWQRCDATGASCVDISGATSQSYTVAAEDEGRTLRVGSTASNRYGSATAFSTATGVVAAPAPSQAGP